MSGRSEEFVSHLPVAFDGSCNGLQNYSMMLRDEVGGAATNLVPSREALRHLHAGGAGLERIVRATRANPEAPSAWAAR
jgi:DNA-directed RNA polymerase